MDELKIDAILNHAEHLNFKKENVANFKKEVERLNPQERLELIWLMTLKLKSSKDELDSMKEIVNAIKILKQI